MTPRPSCGARWSAAGSAASGAAGTAADRLGRRADEEARYRAGRAVPSAPGNTRPSLQHSSPARPKRSRKTVSSASLSSRPERTVRPYRMAQAPCAMRSRCWPEPVRARAGQSRGSSAVARRRSGQGPQRARVDRAAGQLRFRHPDGGEEPTHLLRRLAHHRRGAFHLVEDGVEPERSAELLGPPVRGPRQRPQRRRRGRDRGTVRGLAEIVDIRLPLVRN